MREANESTGPVLIGLRAAEVHHVALGSEFEVIDCDGDQLGSPKAPREANEEQGTVANALGRVAGQGHEVADVLGREGVRLFLGSTVDPADSANRESYQLVGAGVIETGEPVSPCNRALGELYGRYAPARLGQIGEVVRDGLGGGREVEEVLVVAPGGKQRGSRLVGT